MTEKKERKLTDSELNIWIKKIPSPYKEIFYENLYNNNLIWAPGMDIYEKKKRFNNYRYKEIAQPNHTTKILIYITALATDPNLKITDLFPDIPQDYIELLLPMFVKFSLETNNFSYVKNKK